MNKSTLELLTPTNCTFLLIDHQPQMFFGVESVNRGIIINNVVGLAKSAKIFKVPTLLTTVAAKTFSGPLIPQLQTVFPDQKPIDRTSMNSWEDKNLVDAVQKTNRKKLVIAALWSEICLAFPALQSICYISNSRPTAVSRLKESVLSNRLFLLNLGSCTE